MKTQIIKIIPCLLAGFILSACVGAVNVPSEIAEKVIKNTDPDPVIKKTAVVIIDDKEPEPIVVDDKESEPEPIAIEPAHPCIATPFRDICGGEEFNDARKVVCANEPTSHRCLLIIPLVCDADVLDALCNVVETYHPAQKMACKSEKNSERCTITTARVCDANPLDAFCEGLTAYFPAQKQACAEGAYYGCGPTIARVCGADVFVYLDDLCRERRHTQRYDICLGEKNSERCAPIIVRVCGANSLDVLCDDLTTYFPAQKIACKGRDTTTRCQPTILRVCGANPFDAFCYALTWQFSKYASVRETTCLGEKNSERCAPTIKRVCDANVFDSLCTQAEAYFPAQYAACEIKKQQAHRFNTIYDYGSICRPTLERICNSDANPFDTLCYGTNKNGVSIYDSQRERACQTEQNSERCKPTIARVCDADSLDYLCRGLATYFPAQKEACKNKLYGSHRKCQQTITRVCDATPLDSFCRRQVNYFPVQKLACESEPNSDRCAITMARVCAEDQGEPFGAVCQSVNLTGESFPAFPGYRRFVFTSDDIPIAPSDCRYNPHSCTVYIPNGIDIKPLNNTNTGTATYTGQVSVQYAANRNSRFEYNRPLNQNIDIIVNFDNKTLSYSGNFRNGYSFNINGNFTDRGILTGTADFRSNETKLYGLIGQDKAIGVFSKASDDIESAFAGGFTATRE